MNPISSLNPGIARNKSESESDGSNAILRIASLSTAAAFGGALSSAESLRRNPSGFTFQISAGTIAAFIIGSLAVLFYWRIVEKSQLGARRASWVLAIAGVALFLYPLRFAAAGKLPEIAIGLAVATTALSTIALLLWTVKGFLEADDEQVVSAQRQLSAPIGSK